MKRPYPRRTEGPTCGFHCHYERYALYCTQRGLGWKRWGVRDQHRGANLSRLFMTRRAADEWRVSLELGELREREYTAIRAEAQDRMTNAKAARTRLTDKRSSD